MANEETKFIDEEELNKAQDDAEKEEQDAVQKNIDSGKRIVILKKPLNVLGTEYKELHFDFDSLSCSYIFDLPAPTDSVLVQFRIPAGEEFVLNGLLPKKPLLLYPPETGMAG